MDGGATCILGFMLAIGKGLTAIRLGALCALLALAAIGAAALSFIFLG